MKREFSEDELKIRGFHESVIPGRPGVPVYDSPVTTKENLMMALNGEKPYWYPMAGMIGGDYKPFRPRIFPDLFLAHDIMDGEPPVQFDDLPSDMPGWFDTTWRYIKQAGGPMIVPGSQKITDINDWEQLTFPDLNKLDWEGSAERNKNYLNSELPIEFCIPTGIWERIMSILDVSEALITLVEEDKYDAFHAFMNKLSIFYDDMLERVKKYYNTDMVLMHDDWGTQRAPFFSYDTCKEMIFPYFKRFVDKCHSLNMKFEHHCCGKAQDLVPLMIEAGVDLWCGQIMNDYKMLVEKYRGRGILFGIQLPLVTPDLPDERAYEVARELVDTYKNSPVAYVSYGGHPKLYEYVYKLSRQALAG